MLVLYSGAMCWKPFDSQATVKAAVIIIDLPIFYTLLGQINEYIF